MHVQNILATLVIGGSIVMPAPRVELDFDAVIRLIQQHHVAFLMLIPSLLAGWMEHVESHSLWKALSSLRYVAAGGEAAPVSLFQLIRTRLPHVVLYNSYGPTETTIISHEYLVKEARVSHPIPIGNLMPGYTQYILDSEGNSVPVGVLGRLFIGGPGVFRGYLNRPELTTQALCRSNAIRGRVYDSGDLVRLRSDGAVIFCCRDDFQVKIRGQRLELQEIEAVLLSEVRVQQAVVMKQEEQHTHEAVLVAYLLVRASESKSASDPSSSSSSSASNSSSVSSPLTISSGVVSQAPPVGLQAQLIALCKQRLAVYMIPSYFIFLDTMPMTGTGRSIASVYLGLCRQRSSPIQLVKHA